MAFAVALTLMRSRRGASGIHRRSAVFQRVCWGSQHFVDRRSLQRKSKRLTGSQESALVQTQWIERLPISRSSAFDVAAKKPRIRGQIIFRTMIYGVASSRAKLARYPRQCSGFKLSVQFVIMVCWSGRRSITAPAESKKLLTTGCRRAV